MPTVRYIAMNWIRASDLVIVMLGSALIVSLCLL
ncbi:MAG: hypothetical protein JWQ89_2557 [Devosia sp.]|nr:hypothetical protein [Devosia sp.]